MLKILVPVLVVAMAVATLMGCRPQPPASPALVGVYPAPDATLPFLDKVMLEFNQAVRETRLLVLMRGTLPPPIIDGATVNWEVGAGAPHGEWLVAVRGEVTFTSGDTLMVEKDWRFSLLPDTEPIEVPEGIPSSVDVQAGDSAQYVATLASPTIGREAPATEATELWQAPAGVLLLVADPSGGQAGEPVPGYVYVVPPTGRDKSIFRASARYQQLPYPLPEVGAFVSARAVWIVEQPWLPGVAETVVHIPGGEPRLSIAFEGRPEGASQFVMKSPPTTTVVDAAVAYVVFSEVYRTFLHVPSPSPDEVSQATPGDVAFVTKAAKTQFDRELAWVSSLDWPATLTQVKDRVIGFGEMCRDADLAMLRLMNPGQAAEAKAEVARIIESGGLTVPAADDPIFQWGELAQSALNRLAEEIRASILGAARPALVLWEPGVNE